jgi:hypothetical protein
MDDDRHPLFERRACFEDDVVIGRQPGDDLDRGTVVGSELDLLVVDPTVANETDRAIPLP